MKSLPYRLQVSVSVKLNITSNSLHELIRNGARKLIPTTGFKMSLKPCCDNILNAGLVDTTGCRVMPSSVTVITIADLYR
ncbi:MAG: hypothetical protein ACTS73_09700 [Arsenophonus sp. NEOnobi-MAG3]